MNRKLFALLLAVVLLMTSVLTACGKAPDSAAGDNTQQAGTTTDDTTPIPASPTPGIDVTPTGVVVAPIGGNAMPENMTDTSFAPYFTNEDIVLNDEGSMTIHMLVMDYEIFDPTAVGNLQVGDVIVLGGENVMVNSVVRDNGTVLLNRETNLVALGAGEDGLYYQLMDPEADWTPLYRSVGEVTLKVDQEFLYHDLSNPEKGEVVYYPGDLLTMKDTVEFSCNGYHANVNVSGGKIIAINRFYTP